MLANASSKLLLACWVSSETGSLLDVAPIKEMYLVNILIPIKWNKYYGGKMAPSGNFFWKCTHWFKSYYRDTQVNTHDKIK
jgi:hypothetical protein